MIKNAIFIVAELLGKYKNPHIELVIHTSLNI
jgi:hypothetical protein